MQKNKKLFSVITGDIVKSSKLPLAQHKKLINVLKNCSKEIRKIFKDALKYEPELFRGDSFQLLIQKPELAFPIALFYRAYLKANMQVKKIDVRLAISVGTVDYVESSFGVGEAYKISGQALDKKGKRKMKFVSEIIPNSDVINLLIQNTDFITSRWTKNQSKIVLLSLQNYDQITIASKLKITQQAVSKQMESIGWGVVAENISYFNKSVTKHSS